MNYPACPECRLRFTPVQGAVLSGCPGCGEPLHIYARPTAVMGFALYEPESIPQPLPEATSAAIPVPPRP